MSSRHYVLDLPRGNDIRGSMALLNVGSAKFDGDWYSVPHAHHYTELFYIVGGDGQFQIEDKLYPVRARQMVIVSPNVIHTEVGYEARPLEYIVLGIEGLELSGGEMTDRRFRILNHSDGEAIHTCLRNILMETEARAPGYETVCQAYMEILIVRLMRGANLSVTVSPSTPMANRQSASIRHYIDRHYKERLTLDRLANEAKVSKYYLAHAFKREYGISPINYMISCRIEESKRLMLETDLSLSQISHILGFSSASYFSQCFQRLEDMSPTEFRRNYRGEEGWMGLSRSGATRSP